MQDKIKSDFRLEQCVKKKVVIWILIILLVGGFFAFTIWAYTPPAPMPQALAALESDAQIFIRVDEWASFEPTKNRADTAFILYPGGRVDFRSYAPAARAIAEAGYPVFILSMPFNLAVFDIDRAADVMAAYPEIQNWVVGGHSLGGAMAANYAVQNPEDVQGLLLWAAYPASSDDLSGMNIEVTSIYATRDGLSTGEKIDQSRSLLPADTIWMAIEGGNHAQFGWYGDQAGDLPAEISRETQQEQIVAASIALLERVERGQR
jgi:pimeloyl-ACP methyl ester carboxylesterase